MNTTNALSIVIDWSGPYTFEDACKQTGDGLYLSYGRNKLGATPKKLKLMYCGISEDQSGVGSRIKQHEGREFAHADNEWWIGKVRFPSNADRLALEMAEWAIVYFSGTESNVSKTANPPKMPIFLINEWYKPNGERRRRQRSVTLQISDVMCWTPETAQLRTGNLKVTSPN